MAHVLSTLLTIAGIFVTLPLAAQVDLGIDYLLSKRTDLYAFAIYQRAVGSASNAAIFFMQPSSTKSQVEVSFGIRHLF